MDLESITLNEINQTRRQILYFITYMWYLKNKTNKCIITKQKQTRGYRKTTSRYKWGKGRREGQDRGMGLRGRN